MKQSLKTEAAIYGIDDATPKELPYVLLQRKRMWKGLKFKLNLIIVLLAANLLAVLSIDIIAWLATTIKSLF
jgi:hypothetical protein